MMSPAGKRLASGRRRLARAYLLSGGCVGPERLCRRRVQGRPAASLLELQERPADRVDVSPDLAEGAECQPAGQRVRLSRRVHGGPKRSPCGTRYTCPRDASQAFKATLITNAEPMLALLGRAVGRRLRRNV